jgi:predicted Fe-Mo cluster-binding NifX family protein
MCYNFVCCSRKCTNVFGPAAGKRLSSLLIDNLPFVDQPVIVNLAAKNRVYNRRKTMKVAVITDDGKTISQHFGRAPYYLVVTVEGGKITGRELREKLGHRHFASQPHEEEHHCGPHGMGAGSHDKHLQMSDAITDCEALLCGGMGTGAYRSMQARGIRPVVTELQDIDEAVLAYVNGSIVDRVEKLH